MPRAPQTTVVLLAAALVAVGCGKKEPSSASPEAASAAPASKSQGSIHQFTMKRLDGKPASLGAWSGKVLLVVNTASECGYTPQYAGLEKLYETYADRGLVVLGFPSNDFGGQEPGSPAEIATFCKKNYGVTFPMFEKIVTTGSGRAELYALLGSALGEPKWNFHKYLVDKRGMPVKAFPSAVAPDARELTSAIETELQRP
jgi:glutathione peroxidase